MATPTSVELQAGSSGNLAVNAVSSGGQIDIYLVKFDSLDATAYQAMTASVGGGNAVPDFYDDSREPFVLLTKATQQDPLHPLNWLVTCTYGLPVPGQEVRPADTSIERWGVEWTGNSTTREVEIQKAFNTGTSSFKWLKNSAGDPITGVTETKYDAEHVVSFTSTGIDYDLIGDTIGCMNDADITLTQFGNTITFPAKTLLFAAWAYSGVPDPDGSIYPRISWRLLYRKDTWVRKIADKGLRFIDTSVVSGDKRRPIKIGGQLVTDPQYLDGSGQPAAATADVVDLNFEIQLQQDFTDLMAGLST